MAELARTAQLALLACGIAAPLVYVATDAIAGTLWAGYSFRDQTVSELNAFGSPVRRLTIVLGLVGYVVLLAFSVGVWQSAAGNRKLRVVGGLLVIFSVLALWAVPFASMHARGLEKSGSDTMHLVEGAIAVFLLVAAIGLTATAFGQRFRVYSIATIVVFLAFGAWAGMDGPRVAAGLATPWIGMTERISVYSYQLWLVVFAVVMLRHVYRRISPRPRPGPT